MTLLKNQKKELLNYKNSLRKELQATPNTFLMMRKRINLKLYRVILYLDTSLNKLPNLQLMLLILHKMEVDSRRPSRNNSQHQPQLFKLKLNRNLIKMKYKNFTYPVQSLIRNLLAAIRGFYQNQPISSPVMASKRRNFSSYLEETTLTKKITASQQTSATKIHFYSSSAPNLTK